MFPEIRAIVRYEGGKQTGKVPLENIKNFSEPFDPNKVYEIFWSKVVGDTPEKLLASQKEILNIDEEMRKITKPSEKQKLKGSPGYYNAKILAVKG